MFGKSKKNQVNTNRIDSLIGQGTEIVGNVRFKGGLRLEGSVIGDVSIGDEPGVLMIGPMGSIQGNVHVSHLIVDGTLQGKAYADSMIELRSTARVVGDLHYNSIEMHAGSIFQGHMHSHRELVLVQIGSDQQAEKEAPSQPQSSKEAPLPKVQISIQPPPNPAPQGENAVPAGTVAPPPQVKAITLPTS